VLKLTYSNVEFQNFSRGGHSQTPLQGHGKRTGGGERKKGKEGIDESRKGKDNGNRPPTDFVLKVAVADRSVMTVTHLGLSVTP